MKARVLVTVVAVPVAIFSAAPAFPQSIEPSSSIVSGGQFDTTKVAQPAQDSSIGALGSTAALDRPADDGRRTLKAFPANLGRGIVGVFSRDNLAPFLLGAGVAAGSHAFDPRAKTLLVSRCLQCGSTGSTMGGAAVVPVVGAFFLAGRFAPQGPFRDATYDFAEALAVNAVWTGALKYTLHRQRPDGSDFYSMPSGHTSTMFSLATVAEQHFGWKVGLPAYALASAVGLSRIESNKHYLSDVLAGATLGFVVGRTVTRVDGGASKHRTLSVGPATDAHGSGVGLGVAASW